MTAKEAISATNALEIFKAWLEFSSPYDPMIRRIDTVMGILRRVSYDVGRFGERPIALNEMESIHFKYVNAHLRQYTEGMVAMLRECAKWNK